MTWTAALIGVGLLAFLGVASFVYLWLVRTMSDNRFDAVAAAAEYLPKWTARAAEWRRLAAVAREPYIKTVCAGNADLSETMANFWKEKK